MLRLYALLIGASLLFSCSNGNNYEKNLERLDEVYGCDNPMRSLSTRKYKECLAAEKANNETLFDANEKSLDFIFGRDGGNYNYMVQYSVNPHLWQAALQLTNSYPLKIADNQGGYIETDWISEKDSPNNRCLIKIRVLSTEIVSNGVATNFICEEKIDNQWSMIENDFGEEEKQLTLKILSTAAETSKEVI